MPALMLLLLAGMTTGQDVNWGKKVKCFAVQGQIVCPGCNHRAGLTCPRRPGDRLTFDSCLPPAIAPPPVTNPPSAPPTRYRPPPKKNYEKTTVHELTTFASTTPEFTTFKAITPEITTFKKITPEITTFMTTTPEISTLKTIMAKATPFEPYDEAADDAEPSMSDGLVPSKKKLIWRKSTEKDTQSTIPSVPESTKGLEQEDIDWDLILYLYRVMGPPNRRILRDTRKMTVIPDEDLETCNWNGDCPCPLICCARGEGCPKKCVSGIRLPPPWG